MDAPRKQMLLIHGAWQGSWAFSAWLPELARLGWTTHAVDLPGNGCTEDHTPPEQISLGRYVEHVLAELARFEGPVVVLGHSGGGITASQVAEAAPEKVSALVYLAGMMLPSGQSFGDLIRECEALNPGADYCGIGAHLKWSPDGRFSSVPQDAAREVFLHDCPPAAAARAAASLKPQAESGRLMRNTLTAARFGQIPRIYVEALYDRSVMLPLQRRMQLLTPGAHRITLACGHVPQLAEPVALAELLDAELTRLLVTPLSEPA